MIKRLFLSSLLILGVVATTWAGDWQTDPDAAARLAATERRDLFLLFTGTAWCGACIQFEAQVLGKPEFLAGTTAFVRVKLEYPGNEDQLPPDRKAPYIAWRDRHGIRAYPTVILADPDGRPYAITGFDDEINPADFVRKVDRLRPIRDRRDSALAIAAKSAGVAKAHALDDALTAIRGASDPSLAAYHGEMVVRFYRPLIDEVIALDPANAAGLRDRYRDLLGIHDEQSRLTQFKDRLTQVVKDQGAQAALTLFDAEMAQAPSADFRSKLIISKLYLLESAKKYEEARALAEKLAADVTRASSERRNLRLKAAYELMQLDRIDEAVKVYDQLIAEAGSDRAAAYRIARNKGNVLISRRPADAIQALADASLLVSRDSMDWLDVVVPRARILALVGRYDEAITSLNDALTIATLSDVVRTVILAQKASALAKAGRRDEALVVAAQAEAALPGLGAPENQETVDFIRSMLRVAHGQFAAPKP